MAQFNFVEKRKLAPYLSFQPNRRAPIHWWFEYKEGFSRDLVLWLAEQFNLDQNSLVLDPFCGTGTTQLACAEMGIRAIGFDSNPLLAFVARTKLAAPHYNYNRQEIERQAKRLLKEKGGGERLAIPPTPAIVERGFSKWALEDLLRFRAAMSQLDEGARDFFLLALASAAIKASWTVKDGAMIRVVKKKVPPLPIALRSQLNKMLADLKRAPKISNGAEVGDARDMDIESDSIDAVITSPPYINKLEYTKAYAIEEWIIFEKIEEEKKVLGISKESYFADMEKSLGEMARVCKSGAKVAIVIGGGCFPDGVVQSDEEVARLSEKFGFVRGFQKNLDLRQKKSLSQTRAGARELERSKSVRSENP